MGDEFDTPLEDVIEQVGDRLSTDLVSYVEIGDALNLVPWAVLSASCLTVTPAALKQSVSGFGPVGVMHQQSPIK